MENEIVANEVIEQPTEGVQNGLQNEGQETTQEVKRTEPEPLPKGVQKRIDRAVRQKYEAEARAKVLEERLNSFERQSQQAQQTKPNGEPRLEQFDNIEEYVTAKAKWVAKNEMNETLTAREKAYAEQNAQAAQAKSAETWAKRVAKATAEMPDFEDVVESSDVDFKDPVVLHAIVESDLGPQIAYYLASNPDEADVIAGLTGAAAVRAIGRLEAKIEAGTVSATKAPAPIKPVGNKAKSEKAPEEMSPKEFAAWRKSFISSRGNR